MHCMRHLVKLFHLTDFLFEPQQFLLIFSSLNSHRFKKKNRILRLFCTIDCPALIIYRTALTVFIFIARAFITGGWQAAYVYTPEVT